MQWVYNIIPLWYMILCCICSNKTSTLVAWFFSLHNKLITVVGIFNCNSKITATPAVITLYCAVVSGPVIITIKTNHSACVYDCSHCFIYTMGGCNLETMMVVANDVRTLRTLFYILLIIVAMMFWWAKPVCG